VNRHYTLVLTPAELDERPGYTVTVPTLPGCITEGDSFDEAVENAKEAIALYLESLEDRHLPIPPSDVAVTAVQVTVEVPVPA
jgi:predicted RNase H-like HicB family nuclease